MLNSSADLSLQLFIQHFVFPLAFSAICTIIYFALLTIWQREMVNRTLDILQNSFPEEKIFYMNRPNMLIIVILAALLFYGIGLLLAPICISYKGMLYFMDDPKMMLSIYLVPIILLAILIVSSFYVLIISNKRIFTRTLFNIGGIYRNNEIKISDILAFEISQNIRRGNNPAIILKMDDHSQYTIIPNDTDGCLKTLEDFHEIERRL